MGTKKNKGKAKRLSMPLYNLISIWRTIILPPFIKKWQRNLTLRNWEARPDAGLIRRRVDYYCRISSRFSTGDEGIRLRDISLSNAHSGYFYDMMRYLRAFPKNKKVAFINGDTHVNPDVKSIGKARRLDDKIGNVTLMNLDRRRHFLKVDDPIPFKEKKGILFFRGDVDTKENRRRFLEMWWNHPLFDIGDTSPRTSTKWHKNRVSIPEHFNYKYILAPEGNDVASALQWICASNCIPVMTKPTVEGWLMHGAMTPGLDYIEIKDDFSDVEEKIEWYNQHPEEALKIAEASKEWAAQFSDTKRENIIHYLVAERYMSLTT